MTTAEHIAIDPAVNLTNRWGQAAAETKRKIDALTASFRELHLVTTQLQEHDVKVSVDLGPIGNAAYARYHTLEQEKAGTDFRMPTV